MVTETPLSQVNSLIKDKSDLYDSLQFNQYATPPKKDPMMTASFMVGIL